MALKLDDLINKKKEPNQILDLSKIKVKTKEEFEKYFDKIPEFKIRPEKVRPEDAKVRDTDFSFTYTKKDARSKARHEFTYGDPVPPSMRSVRLEDLAAVDINWRMLTMARPKNKLEEDIFSRLVELGKLKLNTARQEAKVQQGASSSGGGPLASLGIIVSKNKRGVTETKVKSCKECMEEFCTGQWCKEFPYDSYTRMLLDKDELEKEEGGTKRKGSKMRNEVKGKVKGKGKLVLKNSKSKTKVKRKRKKKSAKGKKKTDDESD